MEIQQKRFQGAAIRSLKYTLLGIVLFFITKTLVAQLSRIEWHTLTVRPVFVCLSLLFAVAARVLIGLSYYYLLRSSGSPLPAPVAISVSWASLAGRYLPGKVGLLAGAVYLLKRYRVQTAVAGGVPVLATLVTVLTELALSVPLMMPEKSASVSMLLSGVLPMLILFMLFPYSFQSCLNGVGVFFRRYRLPVSWLPFSLTYSNACSWAIFFQSICAGVSTWMMLRSVYPVAVSQLPLIVSISSFSGVVGLLAVFSPAGIGVRDGMYYLTLNTVSGPETAALVTILLRLAQTVADIITASAGSAFLYGEKRRGRWI